MNSLPIIIVGAGAAGLMAARQFLRNGHHVVLLEGRDRAGGRIHTILSGNFVVEGGAEFVHGNLPLTFSLLNEYGIHFTATSGSFARMENGKPKKTNEFVEHWDKLLGLMKDLEQDMPLAEFLSTHFADKKYAGMRASVKAFAEGFDLADIRYASTQALYREWVTEDEGGQYRIRGGYLKIIHAMLEECIRRKCEVHFSSTVKKIEWQKDRVSVHSHDGKLVHGKKLIVTVPLGVLQSGETHESAIEFSPAIPELKAIYDIGFGTVIKIVVECKRAFWNDKVKNLGFVFSDEVFPTWWTQSPDHDATITGWLGCTAAKEIDSKTDEELKTIALDSLAKIFREDGDYINSFVLKTHVFNWSNDPFSIGAYSFPMVGSEAARKLLNDPIQHTIYFAGEGYYDGPCGGTVEAALKSGLDAADKIIANKI